jgi:Protein of unknown function (DUF3106)
MTRALPFGVLLLVCGALFGADQKPSAKNPPPPREAVRPANPRNGGIANKAPGGRQMGAPIINPANPVARLYKASPEQRERALEKLPSNMQEQFRNQLKRFDSLTPAQQQLQIKWVERYSALPREQQTAFKQQLQNLQKLPPERNKPIRAALRRLESMPDAQRRKLLDSDEFKSRFSADELKMISDLSVVMLPPM